MVRRQPLQNIVALKRKGLLTEQQVLAAHRFSKNPNAFVVAPTLYRVLHDAILRDEPLETMEKRRGWPARSAKAIVGLILHALQEMQGSHEEAGEDDASARETVAFLMADDARDLIPLMERFGFTQREARLFRILERSAGNCIGKETLLARLYADRPLDTPDQKILDVFVCKIRKKLDGAPCRIETEHGVGYRLVKLQAPGERDLSWYVQHVYEGKSFREIAAASGVHASTVMRSVNRTAETQDPEALDQAARVLRGGHHQWL
ncbi:winged helix-turn-helix domain-containing protein [Tropicimonas sp. IMCC34043]|uniref:winged helix-turn-helix domain-containing protein n=1 Tax=Tropicimonas sp. IMCC34043 TaxID=2248760 RepID=UPI0018E53BF6|nr:winged helix-turn-helix domain-containing protein [Tropicimonas sp. IMCC34043]